MIYQIGDVLPRMTSEYIPRYNLIINKIEKIIKRDDQIE
jgi:hypothetical protein